MSEQVPVGAVGTVNKPVQGSGSQNVNKPVVPPAVPAVVGGIPVHVFLVPGGKMPTRATAEAAGLDLYSRIPVTVPFKSCIRVPVGIKTVFPPGFYFQVADKSGLSSKGISRRAGVIDSDYRDEWEVVVANETNTDFKVEVGVKIAQAILLELPYPQLIEVNSVDFEKAATTNRGGGFGSTGK